MDEVIRIINKQDVTEKDPGDVEQWRVLIITIIIIIYFNFLNELLSYKVCRV
jgi:hypothetical protein